MSTTPSITGLTRGASRSWTSVPAPALAVAIVAVAFALRVYRLPVLPPGLNGDEAWNLIDILEMQDTRRFPLFFPNNFGREPLFIYVQGAMSLIAGATAFAARLTSAFVGTVTVALLYRFASRLLGPGSWAPLVSASVLSLTLYHVVASRVGLRVISTLPFTIASLFFFWNAYIDGRWRSFLFGGFFLGLTLQTYLSARLVPLVPLGMLAVALLQGWPLPSGMWRKTLAAGVVAASLAAPLVFLAVQDPFAFRYRAETVAVSPTTAVSENLGLVAGMFVLKGDVNINHNLPGRPAYDPALGALFLIGLVVALAGAVGPLRRLLRLSESFGRPSALVMIWFAVMLVPTLLSDGAPHFLRSMGVAPAAAVLAGFGAEALRRRTRAAWRPFVFVGLAGLLFFGAWATARAYFVAWAQHPELPYAFRVPVLAVADHLHPRLLSHPIGLDAASSEDGTFQYVLRRVLSDAPPPRLLDLKHVFVERNGKAVYPSDMEYVFFVHEPLSWGRLFPPWLRDGTVISLKPLGEALSFRLPSSLAAIPDLVFQPPTVAEASFARTLALTGVSLARAPASPGEAVLTVLRWRVLQTPPTDYHLSMRALDAQRRPWGFLDERLGDGFPAFATTNWLAGDTVYTAHWLTLPHDAPPGRYSLAITVFSLDPLQNLTVETPAGPRGDLLEIGEVEMAAPSPLALGAMRPTAPLDHRWAGLRLFGYSLDPVAVQAGEPVDVHLFWRAEDVTNAGAVRLAIEDASGAVVASVVEPPLSGAYPFARWSAGDAFHDVHRLLLPAHAAGGGSRLTITLLGADGTALGESLGVSGPEIRTRVRQFEAPVGLKPLGAEMGDLASLLGYTAPEKLSAGSWPVTLAWRVVGETERSYAVTLQLLDANGRLVAQHDSPPADGAAPTSSWLAGEVVVDARVFALPALAPGRYTLIAALYDPITGERLPVRQGGRTDDHVVVASYAVP